MNFKIGELGHRSLNTRWMICSYQRGSVDKGVLNKLNSVEIITLRRAKRHRVNIRLEQREGLGERRLCTKKDHRYFV